MTDGRRSSRLPEGYDGPTWTADELVRDFDVIVLQAPYVVAIRRADNVKGTLQFVHHPRVFFDFRESS
jgi:hypothetical protein